MQTSGQETPLRPESAGPGDTEVPGHGLTLSPDTHRPWPLCCRVWRGSCSGFFSLSSTPLQIWLILRPLSLSYAVPPAWSVLSLLCQQNSPRPLRACSLSPPAPSLSPLLPPPCLPSLQGLDAHDSDSVLIGSLSIPSRRDLISLMACNRIGAQQLPHFYLQSGPLCLPDSDTQLPAQAFHLGVSKASPSSCV